MAVDKLVDSTQLDADLTSVANAIRTKGGTSADLAFPAGFVSAVNAIPTGGSGDYTAGDVFDATKPVGDVVFAGEYIGLKNSTSAPNYFAYRTKIEKVYAPNYNNTANVGSVFRGCSMTHGVFPSLTKIYNSSFRDCTSLEAFDWLGGSFSGSGNDHFYGCKKLKILVIRKTGSICTLSNTGTFTNTPFASGKSGGTLYVPADLISSYQGATNWSTILGYTNNQIKSIESTATAPDAPIDLTTHYIDGTLIPT